MDHDDDSRDHLDELSRLFDTGTAPQPVAPPQPASPSAGPSAPPAFGQPAYGRPGPEQPAFGQPAFGQSGSGQSAFGEPVPAPASGSEEPGLPTRRGSHAAPPSSEPAPFGSPAPAFGAPTPGAPPRAAEPAAPGTPAPGAPSAPFAPPPLVPPTPLSSGPGSAAGLASAPSSGAQGVSSPPTASATPPPPAAPIPAARPTPPPSDAFAPTETPRSPFTAAAPATPVAPAFGGVPIAPRRDPAPSSALASGLSASPPVTPVVEPETTRSGEPPRPGGVLQETAVPSSPFDTPTVAAPAVAAPRPDRRPPSSTAGAGPAFVPGAPLLPGGSLDELVDDDELARSTLAEKIFFVLAIVLPPIGLIGSAVAAYGSWRRRGWVIGLLRAAMAIGVVLSLVCAGGAYIGYKAYRQQHTHDQIAAQSAAFCSAFTKDKSLGAADGGWPQPAASIPESLTAMQAYVDRWTALAKISPAGIQPGVSSVAAAGAQIVQQVQTQRTVDDAANRPQLVTAVTSAGIAGWRAEYCG